MAVMFSCIFVYLLLHNWTCHARLMLFLNGHPFSQLVSPADAKEPPNPPPQEFASKLVYDHGKYIGYLTPFGDLIILGKSIDQMQNEEFTLTVALNYLNKFLLCVLILLFLKLFWNFFQKYRKNQV